MSDQANSDFTPDREQVADANAAVPVINLSGFSSGSSSERRHVVEAVKHACEHVGFFVVSHHGVSDAKIRAIFAEGRAFFALPVAEKMHIKRPGPGISRGYNSLAGQSLALTRGKQAPPGPDGKPWLRAN